MYIITYATHSERYFPMLKESCPDLVVLGYGKKWNGPGDKVLATLEFCKQHPDSIICFVDGFDSVVVSKDDILQKYKSLQTPLVMSRAAEKSGIHKYAQDKLFGKCKNTRINSGMFIGTSDSILAFWKDYQGDDQTYATQQCRNFNMKIDVNHDIFYNYSPSDDIVVRENRIYVNNKATCVISGPGINPYLKQLGYSPPDIPYTFNYGIKTFLPEIIVFLAACACFCFFPFKWSVGVSVLLFTSLMEYELHIKHYPITMFYKIICLQLDILHVTIFLALVYLMLNVECNVKKLIFLNTLYLMLVLFFFYYKRCILTIFQNKLVNKQVGWTAPIDRIVYFFQDKQYINNNPEHMISWANGNKITCLLVICLNIYCFTQL